MCYLTVLPDVHFAHFFFSKKEVIPSNLPPIQPGIITLQLIPGL